MGLFEMRESLSMSSLLWSGLIIEKYEFSNYTFNKCGWFWAIMQRCKREEKEGVISVGLCRHNALSILLCSLNNQASLGQNIITRKSMRWCTTNCFSLEVLVAQTTIQGAAHRLSNCGPQWLKSWETHASLSGVIQILRVMCNRTSTSTGGIQWLSLPSVFLSWWTPVRHLLLFTQWQISYSPFPLTGNRNNVLLQLCSIETRRW